MQKRIFDENTNVLPVNAKLPASELQEISNGGDLVGNLKVNTSESAVATIIRVQLQLLDTIETNLENVKISNDPEFLHDLRVAIRRVRSAFSLVQSALLAQLAIHFRAEFAWLQQVTGTTRDLQVQELALNSYRSKLPPKLNEALEPWAKFLVDQQVVAKTNLIQTLESNRLKELLIGWRGALTSPDIAYETGKSLKKIVNTRLRRLHRQVLEEGNLISINSASESYHDLRKICKKLRYLLEFFQDHYDPALMKVTLKQIKMLLGTLGNYQDVVVQTHMLLSNRNNFINTESLMHSSVQDALDTLFVTLQHRTEAIKTQVIECLNIFSDICGKYSFDKLLRSYV